MYFLNASSGVSVTYTLYRRTLGTTLRVIQSTKYAATPGSPASCAIRVMSSTSANVNSVTPPSFAEHISRLMLWHLPSQGFHATSTIRLTSSPHTHTLPPSIYSLTLPNGVLLTSCSITIESISIPPVYSTNPTDTTCSASICSRSCSSQIRYSRSTQPPAAHLHRLPRQHVRSIAIPHRLNLPPLQKSAHRADSLRSLWISCSNRIDQAGSCSMRSTVSVVI